MDQDKKDILAIAHGYTQQMGQIHGTNKWIDRMFWNAAEAAETGNSAACKLLRIEGDQAIMDDRSQSEPREIMWPVKDLMYGKAVREANGFVLFMPFLSVDERINLMVSPDGHGYGHLMGEDSL